MGGSEERRVDLEEGGRGEKGRRVVGIETLADVEHGVGGWVGYWNPDWTDINQANSHMRKISGVLKDRW